MIRRPPRSTQSRSSAASDVYKRQMDTLLEDIADIKPHYMVSVPRLYEKVHAGVLANVEGEPPIKQKIFRWAVGVLSLIHISEPTRLGMRSYAVFCLKK